MSRPLVIASLACLLAALALAPSARAGAVTYGEVMAAIQTAHEQDQQLARRQGGEKNALRAQLAKHPPGPGWADFGWSDAPVVADIDMLENLLAFAKNLDLYGRKDRPTRLLFAGLAHRCEKAAASYSPTNALPSGYAKYLAHLPEYARATELSQSRRPAHERAWLLAAAFLRQESGSDQLAPDAWKQSPTESSPAFRRFKKRIAALTVEANSMAKRYGARITVDWPATLALLLENVRARADLWSMALVADISETTATEGLKTITDLFRIDNNQDAIQQDVILSRMEGYPPQSPPERRFARKALRALEDYEIEADLDSKRSAVVDKAGRITYRTR